MYSRFLAQFRLWNSRGSVRTTYFSGLVSLRASIPSCEFTWPICCAKLTLPGGQLSPPRFPQSRLLEDPTPISAHLA